MDRMPHVALVVLLLVASVATVAAAGVVESGQTTSGADASTTLPGTQYSGAVSAQTAEVDADHRGLAFEIRLANTTTNASSAAVVAREVGSIRERLDDLETRARTLQDRSEDEDGVTDAEATALVARSVSLERHVLRVEGAAATLPDPARERYEITPAVFQVLLDRVDALTTPEMVDVARDLAGNDVGESLDESEEDGGDADEDESDETDGDESATENTETEDTETEDTETEDGDTAVDGDGSDDGDSNTATDGDAGDGGSTGSGDDAAGGDGDETDGGDGSDSEDDPAADETG